MMPTRLPLVVDAFLRALAYCVHPRVVALSFLPLVALVLGAFAGAYWLWDAAVAAVLGGLQAWALLDVSEQWLHTMGMSGLTSVLAPFLVLVLATPLMVLITLLCVSVLMTPAMVDLVSIRRFVALERRHGAGFWRSAWWSIGSTAITLLVLIVTLPLWLIPPLGIVIPPLLWGWLTYRVCSFDALAVHASVEERHALVAKHRLTLWAMGTMCGFLGAIPSVLWATGALWIAMAPILIPLAIWIYTLVFAFAALWFVHFLLYALQLQRQHTSATQSSSFTAAPIIDVDSRSLP